MKKSLSGAVVNVLIYNIVISEFEHLDDYSSEGLNSTTILLQA